MRAARREPTRSTLPPARLSQAPERTPGAGRAIPGHGNQSLQHALLAQGAQFKLTVNEPNDAYEREADAVADRVTRTPETQVQRACASCEEDAHRVRRKPAGDAAAGVRATPAAENAISGLGTGAPLSESARAFFEPRFGQDLSSVRIHNGNRAEEAARAVHARAFTLGRDIVFRSGEYAPETASGRHLLAHEITHTLQQGGGAPGGERVQRVTDEALAARHEYRERQARARVDKGPCPCPPGTSSRYDDSTFEYIAKVAPMLNRAAKDAGVPAEAVAGAIADEFDVRNSRRRSWLDSLQDMIVDNWTDAEIAAQQAGGNRFKVNNALLNDIGPANVNVKTALDLVKAGELSVPGSPKASPSVEKIVDFLLTDEGTVHAATAVIKRAQSRFGPYLGPLDPPNREAVLMEYFKQGESYYQRFQENRKKNPAHLPCPGDDGCEFKANRARLQIALRGPATGRP